MLSKLRLSACLSLNNRTRPILDGDVEVEGVDLLTSSVHPSEMFWRQLHFGDFDISEMSLSSLLIMIDRHGPANVDWVALPVFATREFFHTLVLVREDSGIRAPEHLAGRRVGVPEYQQTSALWTRGILQDHFGVSPSDIDWFMERTAELDHASGTGFVPPEGVKIERIPATESIGSYLESGMIDASLSLLSDANLVDRSAEMPRGGGVVAPLFRDVDQEVARYFDATGIYPMNHTIVVRRTIVEAHPWVVLNLYSAFVRANEVAFGTARSLAREYVAPGGRPCQLGNPFRYGIRDNLRELEALAGYAYAQGLTSRPVAPHELFDTRTVEL